MYRKVNAVEVIQQTKKDDFWVQTQVLLQIYILANVMIKNWAAVRNIPLLNDGDGKSSIYPPLLNISNYESI